MNNNCGALCGYWSPPVPVEAGKSYTASVWFRVTPSLVGVSGVYLTIRVPDGQGGYQALFGRPVRATSTDWAAADLVGARLPVGVTSIVIDIAWLDHVRSGDPDGQVWIDDVYFGPP